MSTNPTCSARPPQRAVRRGAARFVAATRDRFTLETISRAPGFAPA
jgi:hypothetical protein